MKILKVRWIDSCASNLNWTLKDELDGDIKPIEILSFGVLIQDSDDVITLAQNYGIDPEQYCSLMTIPKGCIKDVQIIEEHNMASQEVISRLRAEIEKAREQLEDSNYYLDNSEQALGYSAALDDIGQFLDSIQAEESTYIACACNDSASCTTTDGKPHNPAYND